MNLATKWDREAHDAETMAKNMNYTPLEARLLRQRALVKRADAQELRAEFATVSRGG